VLKKAGHLTAEIVKPLQSYKLFLNYQVTPPAQFLLSVC